MGGGMMGGGMMGGGTKDSAPTGSGMGGMMGGGMMGGGMMGGGTKDSAPTSPEENEIKKSPAAAAVGEIRPLNGRNFEGWNGLFFKKEVIDPSKVFRIEGDELVWAGHAGRIFTNNSFRDFSFKFEYLLPLNGRYGTTYCLFKLAEGDPYQVGEANFRVGGVRCALTNGQEGKTGDIVLTRYDLENTDRYLAQRTADATRPANEWNEVEIRCEGRVIQFFLNGREVNRVEGNRAITCHPGFHCDATDIRIRNIRIIPLASAGVAPAPKNSGRLKVQNKPASRKAAKKIVVDALQPGTAWEGTWTYEDPEYSGQRASYRLTISERSGDHFKAVSDYQYGTFSVRSNVEGTIQGDHIDYKEVGREKWRYSSLGTIVGNEINSRFQGTGAAGKARFGKGQMKLQEK